MSEEKHGRTILFFDKPNMDFIEKENLRRKINHNKFFAFFKKEKEELYVRFYWQSNEVESPYRKHLNLLRVYLRAVYGIRLISIETNKDVDIAILNDMLTILFDVDDNSQRPKKIILCSGDKDFGAVLGLIKRRLNNVQITVISGKKHCSEVLEKISDETIFVEDMVKDNENLLLGFSDPIE
ncbi:MAG: NYN domain-containing protein [Candidatus Nealsonbacteria bacterium]